MAKKYKTISELPQDPKGRAIHVVLDECTYGRLKDLCEASYRNVPQTIRFLIDQEWNMEKMYNVSNPTTVG